MYDLFRKPAARFTGQHDYGEMPYLRRLYAGQIEDIQAYYHRKPKRVDADNLLGNLLVHIPLRLDLDDQRYLRYLEDNVTGVERAFGITSATFRGRVHESGVSLGPNTDEVVLSATDSVELKNFDKTWWRHAAFTYLYHTRTDLYMPIQNNLAPAKGHGVAVLNLPLMALQYRHWYKRQGDSSNGRESIYRFIGRFVLPNAIDSYLDIAFFNRLARLSNGIGLPKDKTSHPFYLTDLSRRVDSLIGKIIKDQPRRSGDVEQVVNTTPMLIKRNLWEVMQLPKGPVTRQNEWALQLARLPYMRYLVETAVKHNVGDKTYLNQLYLSLIEANQDNIFSGVGSPAIVQSYRTQLRNMITLLETKGQGWG